MSQVSQFQKQILSELGIVSWKMRETEDAQNNSKETAVDDAGTAKTHTNSSSETAPKTTKSSGLSGLELIKQQMAKSGEVKTPAPEAKAPKVSPVTKPAAPVEPLKPVLEFKPEVLLWQSTGMPVTDIQLTFEILEIPFQLVTSDSKPAHRFPLLVAAQAPQKLMADKLVILNSPEAKKQLWQALLDFKQATGKAN